MEFVTALAVGPITEQRVRLREIFGARNWRLLEAAGCGEALQIACEQSVQVVISGRDLPDGSWKELLKELSEAPVPPSLILTSGSPDERLWAELLNLGAYDLLAEPLDRDEVVRVVSLASGHWRNECERLQGPDKVRTAGGGDL